MRLAISRDVLPDVAIDELREAAQRRGIDAVDESAPEDSLVLDASMEDVAAGYAAALNEGLLIEHITLRGSGAEAAFHEGKGIGSLMSRLAIDGYTGTLLLARSRDAAKPIWRTWLLHRQAWGCGSKPKKVTVDVRPVEPRDRFETIMGAYNSLGSGERMHLIVDHDPKCMYYTLRATRGEASFTFDYVENGPETWQVMVRKNGD